MCNYLSDFSCISLCQTKNNITVTNHYDVSHIDINLPIMLLTDFSVWSVGGIFSKDKKLNISNEEHEISSLYLKFSCFMKTQGSCKRGGGESYQKLILLSPE